MENIFVLFFHSHNRTEMLIKGEEVDQWHGMFQVQWSFKLLLSQVTIFSMYNGLTLVIVTFNPS